MANQGIDEDVLSKGGIEFRLKNNILQEHTLVRKGSINTISEGWCLQQCVCVAGS
jgi:hypothetical protein